MADEEKFVFPASESSKKIIASQMEPQLDRQARLDAEAEEKKKADLRKIEDAKVKAAQKRPKKGILGRIYSFGRRQAGPMGVTNAKGFIGAKMSFTQDAKAFAAILGESLTVGFLAGIFMHNFGWAISIMNIAGWAIGFWLIRYKMPGAWRAYRR